MPKVKGIVLVVDDEEEVREGVAEILLLHGYGVHAAASASEALQLLRGEAIDAVLLDLIMPGLTALDFRRAQTAEPGMAAIPVILMTGHVEIAEQARLLGAIACLRKPFDEARLLAALREALESKRWRVDAVRGARPPSQKPS